jgi:hypothetical protein
MMSIRPLMTKRSIQNDITCSIREMMSEWYHCSLIENKDQNHVHCLGPVNNPRVLAVDNTGKTKLINVFSYQPQFMKLYWLEQRMSNTFLQISGTTRSPWKRGGQRSRS